MRFILILALIALIAGLIFVKNEILNLRSKLIISIISAIILGGGFALSEFEKSTADKRTDLLENFSQGKNIKCGEIEVNSSTFNYEYGTQSFIARPEFKQLSGIVISISKCLK